MKLNNLNLRELESSITNRDEVVNAFIRSAKRYKQLTADEEKTATAEQLVNSNLLFVLTIAKMYEHCSCLALADLIQEGCIGLTIAASKFDVSRETRFLSFAVFEIRAAILAAINDYGRLVRLPNNLYKTRQECVSGDEQIGTDSDSATLFDLMSGGNDSDGADDDDDLAYRLACKMSKLSDKEQDIIGGLLGLYGVLETEYTLAKKYKQTEERIRQIKIECIKKMRS